MDEPIISALLTRALQPSSAAEPLGGGQSPGEGGRAHHGNLKVVRIGQNIASTLLSVYTIRLPPCEAPPVFFFKIRILAGISSWRLNPDSESKEVDSKSFHSPLIMPARWDSRRQTWTGED